MVSLSQVYSKYERLIVVISGTLSIIGMGYQGWDHFRARPGLVAEVSSIDARLPTTVTQWASAVPDSVGQLLQSDQDVAKEIPSKPLRASVANSVSKSLKQQQPYWTTSNILTDRLTFIDIINQTDTTATDVRMAVSNPAGQDVLIVGADGTERNVKMNGAIALGDLPPGSKIKVFAWGMFGYMVDAPGYLTVSSSEGLARVQTLQMLPQGGAVAGDGVYITYKELAKCLYIALMLLPSILYAERYLFPHPRA